MDSSKTSPPPTHSQLSFIKRLVWHSEDVALVEDKVFELCKDDFGITKNHYSVPVKDSNGIPISNASFLPPPGARFEDYYWDITGDSGPPLRPDRRELWVHLRRSDADELTTARTPLELCIAVGHSMLGWLSMLYKGFLHRDIAITGVLCLYDPIEMTPFVPGDFSQVLEQPWGDDQILQDQVERLQKAIADLEITGSCCGVVHPSDMTVKMKDYYTSIENADPPDCYEFMSSGLLRSIRRSEPYLHSPVDDLESFYYTAQWAAARNQGSDAGRIETDDLKTLRARLSVTADIRFQATLLLHRINPNSQEDIRKFGAFLPKLQPVLKEWYPSILMLMKSWRTVKDGVDEADVSQYYIRHALAFAYRGVADYLNIVHKHRKSLE